MLTIILLKRILNLASNLLYEALKKNHENIAQLELDNAEYENTQVQEKSIYSMISLHEKLLLKK